MIKKNIVTYFVGIFFSAMLVLTIYIGKYSNYNDSFITEFHFNKWFFVPILIISIPCFFILRYALNLFSKFSIKSSKKSWNSNKIFLISLFSIFISGIIFLLTYYPGTGLIDSIHIISNPISFSNQYPLIYSLISYAFFQIFFFITNSMNLSFFLMELTQLVFMTFILAYIITWFHKKYNSNFFTIFNILYFNVLTIFSNYNSAHLRDTIFSALFLILIVLLHELIETNGICLTLDKFRTKIVIVLCLLSYTRNNAIFTIFILLLFLFIKYKKYYKELIVIIFCVMIMSNITIFLPEKYNREKLFQESASVPIQQLSYIITYEDISVEDKEYIDNLLPTEIIKELYHPFIVDRIKWSVLFDNYYLNKTKKEFLKVWLKNMNNHSEGYLKAYLLNTYGLWSINEFSDWESCFFEINSTYKNLKNTPIFPANIQKKLEKFYQITCRYINNGAIFWIYVFLFLLLIYKKKKEYLLIFVPFFSIWLNLMLASPLSSAFRYMSMFGYALPFILTITFSKQEVDSGL